MHNFFMEFTEKLLCAQCTLRLNIIINNNAEKTGKEQFAFKSGVKPTS